MKNRRIMILVWLFATTCVAMGSELAGTDSAGADSSATEPSSDKGALAQQDRDLSDDILVIVGAEGNAEFGDQFRSWLADWKQIGAAAKAQMHLVGVDDLSDQSDRQQCQTKIHQLVSVKSTAPLWIVMIGHGTYTRGVAKFNLRGPDVSAEEFAQWFSGQNRPVVLINSSSSSGPFINRMSGEDRIVVTATKSGTEQNFARFGEYFAKAIGRSESDLDHDDEVSVLEAFLFASSAVREFYQSEARIATEHALIDDNGDGKGTPPKMFRVTRPIGTAKDGAELDGRLARRITLSPAATRLSLTPAESAARDELEQRLDEIRQSRDELGEGEYLLQIEPVLVELARIYRAAEARAAPAE